MRERELGLNRMTKPHRTFDAPLAAAALAVGLAACTTTQRTDVVRAPSPCFDRTVQIYFEPQSSEVTREGRAVISAAAAAVKSCKVTSVEVIGLADAAGAPAASLELSQKRAASVAGELKADGLPAAEFKVAAAGQAGAVTAGGQAAPMRRRADIVLHMTPP
jgi:outer membrane protein OmpA-like peptidoglycan-associated protein